MSEQTPTQRVPANADTPAEALPGQVTQPNPLEIIWEKHKKTIIGVCVALLVVFGGFKLKDYLARQARNRTWTAFAQSLGLEAGYTPKDWSPIDFYSFAYRPYLKFREALTEVPTTEIEAAVKQFGAAPPGQLAQWALAARYGAEGKPDAAKAVLDALAKVNPKFEGLTKVDAPPVYVELPDEPDDKDAAKPKKRADPDPAPPAALSDLLVAHAKRAKEFRAAHAELYEPPDPDAKPQITFETNEGKIEIRLYMKRAPKHCKQFIENCKAKYYEGMRFHEIHRRPTGANGAFNGEYVSLGDPESKNEDRSKWGMFHSKEQVEHEDSGVSHFPFMLSADRESSKIGSDKKLIHFTAGDCAEWRDGSYVVFGRVVNPEGQDLIRRLANAQLSSSQEENDGRGKPTTTFKVTKVSVVE